MINLDDFNLDAISEKAKDNEEVIDEDEALQRAGHTEVTDDNNEVGTESYDNLVESYNFTHLLPSASAGMEALNESQMVGIRTVPANLSEPFTIRTTDDKNYRIYFSMVAIFLPRVVSALCRFLDTRKQGDTVTLVLGSGLDDRQSHAVGAIVSAMSTSRAQVTAVAAGWCSITETIIWVSAARSEIYKYGALTFGVSEITKQVTKLKPYFDLFLNKGKKLGLITDNDIKNIWDTDQTKVITYEDYLKLQNAPQDHSDQEQKDSEVPLAQF